MVQGKRPSRAGLVRTTNSARIGLRAVSAGLLVLGLGLMIHPFGATEATQSLEPSRESSVREPSVRQSSVRQSSVGQPSASQIESSRPYPPSDEALPHAPEQPMMQGVEIVFSPGTHGFLRREEMRLPGSYPVVIEALQALRLGFLSLSDLPDVLSEPQWRFVGWTVRSVKASPEVPSYPYQLPEFAREKEESALDRIAGAAGPPSEEEADREANGLQADWLDPDPDRVFRSEQLTLLPLRAKPGQVWLISAQYRRIPQSPDSYVNTIFTRQDEVKLKPIPATGERAK